MTAANDVALPAGVQVSTDWYQYHELGISRSVCGRDRGLTGRSGFIVATSGIQDRDGTIRDRTCTVYLPGNDELTSREARELAALLVQAADELDRWQSPA